MDPVLPVFLGIAVSEQVAELREYLKSNGSNIEETGPEDLSENLSEIFNAYKECMKTYNEQESEGFLNSILSLIFALTEKRDDVICAFLKFLADMPHKISLKTMNILFCGLNKLDPIRYEIYCVQLESACKSGLLNLVNTDINEVKSWLTTWNNLDKTRKIYRLLHNCFAANEQRERATAVMIELLRTYPDGAKDDAINCIVSFIDKSDVWIMDHLLDLGPVKSLSGELIYQLLEIFVHGNINDYMKFHEENSNFVISTGLNHERNLKKMRILSFVSLVNRHDEITFEKLSKELNINIEDVEHFIIDVLKTRLVHVWIDQVQSRIITSSAAHRTFDNEQWKILQQKLRDWQSNLQIVEKQLLDTV